MMEMPKGFHDDGNGFYFYRSYPIFIRRFGRRDKVNYVVGSRSKNPHYTAIPGFGDEALMEAVTLAKKYAKEYRKKARAMA